MIRSHISWLSKRRNACVLDLGPVCDNTINFFLPHVKKVFIFDLFLHLSRHRDLPKAIENFDYKPHSFDALHLWDLIDYLFIIKQMLFSPEAGWFSTVNRLY